MKNPSVPKAVKSFSSSFESVWQAFQKLGNACHEAGPLNERERQHVKIGLAAAAHSEGAVHSAVRNARAAGISATEIRHVIVMNPSKTGHLRRVG